MHLICHYDHGKSNTKIFFSLVNAVIRCVKKTWINFFMFIYKKNTIITWIENLRVVIQAVFMLQLFFERWFCYFYSKTVIFFLTTCMFFSNHIDLEKTQSIKYWTLHVRHVCVRSSTIKVALCWFISLW